MTPKATTIPVMFVVLNLIAMVFFAGGIVGLLLPDLAPALADKSVAWALIAVGIILDGAAVVNLLTTMKGNKRIAGH